MGDDYEGFVFTSGDGIEDADSLIDEAMRNRISEETFFLAPDRLYIVFDSIDVDKVPQTLAPPTFFSRVCLVFLKRTMII